MERESRGLTLRLATVTWRSNRRSERVSGERTQMFSADDIVRLISARLERSKWLGGKKRVHVVSALLLLFFDVLRLLNLRIPLISTFSHSTGPGGFELDVIAREQAVAADTSY